MRRHHVAALLSLAVAVSFALPAFGAPSPLALGKKALGVAKKANKRAKKAGKRAKTADKNARDALRMLAGSVPSAQVAKSLDNLVLTGRQRVGPSASAPGDDAARAAAQLVPLIERGPLKIYGKCFKNTMPTPRVHAEVFIASTVEGSVVSSASVRFEGPNNNGFLNPEEPETMRRLVEDSAQAGAQPGFGSDPWEHTFHAMAPDGSTLSGTVLIGVRETNSLAPAGAYGEGDVCFFAGQAWVFG